MATILNNGIKTTIQNVNTSRLTGREIDILRYAIGSYGFVNKLGVAYSFKEWIENIKAVYEMTGRTAAVINVLAKC